MGSDYISISYSSEGELFKHLLGSEWNNLHPDIQKRFEKNPSPGTPLKYTGLLEELSCSRWGKFIGHITKPFISGALIPYTEYDVPVDIQVYTKDGSSNIYKERIYRLVNRRPIKFTSYMRQSSKGDVLEYVGFGLGMKLIVFVKDSNLHFKSDGYFWDIGIFRIPIPDIFSPGATYLTHVNEGPNQFRIRIDITHIFFGKMFVQAGVFTEE